MVEIGFFYLFATIAVVASLGVILLKNPVTAAMLLVITLCALAAEYVLLGAEFSAAIQVLVYAGAIVILFTFVIMLLNLGQEEVGQLTGFSKWAMLALMLGGAGVILIQRLSVGSLPPAVPVGPSVDNTYEVGMALFTKYLWPFELASLLILLAMIASIVIAKKPTLSSRDA
jgi:NADH-quinone oxidoreductase subunit J